MVDKRKERSRADHHSDTDDTDQLPIQTDASIRASLKKYGDSTTYSFSEIPPALASTNLKPTPSPETLESDHIILRTLNEHFNSIKPLSNPSSSSSLTETPSPYFQVTYLPAASVMTKIEKLLFDASKSVANGEVTSFTIPSRFPSNQIFDHTTGQNRLGNKVFTRQKTAIINYIMIIVHNLCKNNLEMSNRELFYTNKKCFKLQSVCDVALDDLACILGCTRSSLRVIPEVKGRVIGELTFKDDEGEVNCKTGPVKTIPHHVERCEIIRSGAVFILVVEKHATLTRLARDRFHHRFPCIIISGQGQPDVVTRAFLRKLKTVLNIPVLALMDCDPYGFRIMSVYRHGSKNMSYDSANLTTPDIRWLGVRPRDLNSFKIPEEQRLPMNGNDIKVVNDLLEEEFVKNNCKWKDELKSMEEMKLMAEIEALSFFGITYLTKVYLPLKLQRRDWI